MFLKREEKRKLTLRSENPACPDLEITGTDFLIGKKKGVVDGLIKARGVSRIHGKITKEQLSTFRPSVCNRLDRNTIGLVIGSKSLFGSQQINELISSRQIRKFYRMFVKGQILKEETLEGYLIKNERTNTVQITKNESDKNASYIKTRYYPIRQFRDRTLVEAELITGKTHQLRIHMASIGHPLLGDYKYGDRNWNNQYKQQYHIDSQLLYACRLETPKLEAPLSSFGERAIEAPVPEVFIKLMADS